MNPAMARGRGIAQTLRTAVFLPTVAALWLMICPSGAPAVGLAEFAVKAEKAAVTVWSPLDSADQAAQTPRELLERPTGLDAETHQGQAHPPADQTASPAIELAMPPAAGSLPDATDSAIQRTVASPPAGERASTNPGQSPERPSSDDNAPVVSPPGNMSDGGEAEKKPLP